jgi:putative addiction module killer protein
VYEIRTYVTPEGKDVFAQWFKKLRNHQAMVAIDRRVDGMSEGNFGDHKPCRDGVWELRINAGPGYRVYYGIAGKHVVLLLNGGDKSTQSRDIEKACLYWKAWKEEQGK